MLECTFYNVFSSSSSLDIISLYWWKWYNFLSIDPYSLLAFCFTGQWRDGHIGIDEQEFQSDAKSLLCRCRSIYWRVTLWGSWMGVIFHHFLCSPTMHELLPKSIHLSTYQCWRPSTIIILQVWGAHAVQDSQHFSHPEFPTAGIPHVKLKG